METEESGIVLSRFLYRMKKGQIIEGKVAKVEFPNRGILKEEGCQIEVKGVLAQQKVSVMIRKARHGKAEGRCLQVLEKAPYEIEAKCPHAGFCGGCSYQTVPYEKQLAIKEQQVIELMRPIFEKQAAIERKTDSENKHPSIAGYVEGESGQAFREERENEVDMQAAYDAWAADAVRARVFEGIRPSPLQFGYRNKMEFTFGDEYKDGPLTLGMHKKGSFYDIVHTNECRIVDEDYRMILSAVADFAVEKGIRYFHRMSHEGYLRHLLVRKAARTKEIMVALITTTQEEHGEELQELWDRILALPLEGKIRGILHTENDSLADVVQSDRSKILYGQDYFYEELLGLKFRITEFSFFQTNSLGAEVLYETVRELIGEIHTASGEKPVIYDLYSGTGTIAQMMAPVASRVIGVEIVEEAVLAARENAELNGLCNCEFIVGDVLKVMDTIERQPDFIILDPPRDGIHPKALQKIIRYGVERLVYVSCKPTSLARDLEVFLENGYRVERMRCVDMFPGTVHVETVVLIQRVGT